MRSFRESLQVTLLGSFVTRPELLVGDPFVAAIVGPCCITPGELFWKVLAGGIDNVFIEADFEEMRKAAFDNLLKSIGG